MCQSHDAVFGKHHFKLPHKNGAVTYERSYWRVLWDKINGRITKHSGRVMFVYKDIQKHIPEYITRKTIYDTDIEMKSIVIFPNSMRRKGFSPERRDKNTLDQLKQNGITKDLSIKQLQSVIEQTPNKLYYRVNYFINSNSFYSLWKYVDIENFEFKGSTASCSRKRLYDEYEAVKNWPDYRKKTCRMVIDSKKFDLFYNFGILEINVQHAEKLRDYMDQKLALWEVK